MAPRPGAIGPPTARDQPDHPAPRPTTGLFFWGATKKIGVYGSTNADFGHAHKAFWFLYNVDRLLPDHPFAGYVENARAALEFGWDEAYSRWAQAPTSPTTVAYGSTWWGHIEGDQLSATLNLIDGRYTDRLARSAQTFLDLFVDRADPAREGPQLVARDGTWTNPTKAGPNKNAYHSVEHALMLYLHGRALEGVPAELHFAVPANRAMHFAATPYLFRGDEVSRRISGNVDVLEPAEGKDGPQRKHVVVSFAGLH